MTHLLCNTTSTSTYDTSSPGAVISICSVIVTDSVVSKHCSSLKLTMGGSYGIVQAICVCALPSNRIICIVIGIRSFMGDGYLSPFWVRLCDQSSLFVGRFFQGHFLLIEYPRSGN